MDSKIPIIKRNLNIAASSENMARLIRLGQAEELAKLISGRSITPSQAAKYFRSAFKTPLLSDEYLAFCKCITEYGTVDEAGTLDLFNKNATVSYLKNNYSQTAFEKFRTVLSAEAVYETDFNSVCESVYLGNSDYAIVPLFNTNDGLMVSLYRMILRYELKAVLSADVMMNDGMTETKFMLFGKRENAKISFSRILLSFTDDTNITLPGLLAVCANVGVKLRFINTLPLEYTDDRREMVLDMELGDFDKKSFLLFIKTALPDINIIGMYKAVK